MESENPVPQLGNFSPFEAKDDRPQQYYEHIKQKFAEERDLRLSYRPEGTKQYTSDLAPRARTVCCGQGQ